MWGRGYRVGKMSGLSVCKRGSREIGCGGVLRVCWFVFFFFLFFLFFFFFQAEDGIRDTEL